MTQDKFVQARRKKEAYRGTLTDDNADCADLDKSNAQVINGQFLMVGWSSPRNIAVISLGIFFLIYAVYILLAYISLKRNVLPE